MTSTDTQSNPAARRIELEQIACPLCDGEKYTQHLVGHDLQYPIPGEFTLVRCDGCRHVYMNPRPTADTISLCYPENYGPHRQKISNGAEPHDSNLNSKSAATAAVAKQQSESAASPDTSQPWYLNRFVRAIPGLRGLYFWLTDTRSHVVPPFNLENSHTPHALEIGCANGQFLQQLKESGWRVKGVEPADAAASAARAAGLDVSTGQLTDARFSDNQFDAAFAWMVIEHLPDPRETLLELQRVIRPGGWLAFSIPNFGCWEPKVFGKYWDALELPRHLQHFSRRTIRQLLHDTGFDLHSIQCQHNLLNVVGSLGFWWRSRRPNSRLAKRLIEFPHQPTLRGQLLLAPFARMLSLIGQGGRFTILARTTKKNDDAPQ